MVGVQGEDRSHRVLRAVLGSLAFTLGATVTHGRILSRGVPGSDLSLRFTVTAEWVAGGEGQGQEEAEDMRGALRKAGFWCALLSARGSLCAYP